ncbi:class I SAM-dependent methyltransferase [Pseudaminobacter sp. 19-2017]|uniref:Class I SAM-dependent methyltransferase n=1 Tax=Pseudaminobacter soli (ex Zhang et al. 2022) TaxID=2831468 RepID=A0A942E5G9_9HYPH|nr:class I SAM-dependent methyltransferase [Pseudaminobacter soli]MBS3650910.1 class I SAM-dependent methyltransferase [Pseudaminobacter soli]
MTTLKERIAALVSAIGPISVAEYFALCLSDPTHGYYTTRDPFGRAGDFTTAPEISQMFGELIGVWLATAWRAIGQPENPAIIELGPGRGTLAKDVSRTIAKLEPALRTSAEWHLVETSPKLREIQAATLQECGRFTWHDSLDEVPRRPLLVVANELFDALPLRQYVKQGGAWRDRCVALDVEGGLTFVAGAGTLDPIFLPPDGEAQPEGSVFEIAPARTALMQQIAERIARDGGAGIFFDYGHLVPGFGDTLQAVRNHHYEGVLDTPGEADLTSHVDFAALAEVARAAGLEVDQSTQGAFLLGMGLLERAGRLGSGAGQARQDEVRVAVERLAGPDQMGELFKVMAVLPRGVKVPPFWP